uniref:Uncharacterized protein n=1 Tax=Trichogramma kaykai TaxID=54128 RepID=A0ABD2WG80_9HYME
MCRYRCLYTHIISGNDQDFVICSHRQLAVCKLAHFSHPCSLLARLKRVLDRGIKRRRQIYRVHRRTCHRDNTSVLARPRMYCTRRSKKKAPRHRRHALTYTRLHNVFGAMRVCGR